VAIGAIVAGFYVDPPTVSPALIRTTLPLPPNTFDPDSPINPLRLIYLDGTPIETQIEVVTRHPGPGEGAAVVELIGRINVPPGQTKPLTILVQRFDNSRILPPPSPSVADFYNTPLDVPAPVQSLLKNPHQIQLAVEDAFGKLYMLDLVHDTELSKGERRIERFGELQTEFRHHGWMGPLFPTTGPNGTLSHMFGVHAYVRISAGDPVIELDLRIHNGADGRTADNEAQGPLYFRKLSLVLPPGWSASPRFKDPLFGEKETVGQFVVYPIVDDSGDGKMHIMPQLGQMHRRLIIAPEMETARAKSHINSEGLGFVRPGPGPVRAPLLWSWWHPSSSNYFPQAHLLPRMEQVPTSAFKDIARQDYEFLKGHFENGTGGSNYPISSNALGWAHPYGIPYGGMTGGDGIQFYYGLEALLGHSSDGYRYLQLLHRMGTERMPNALYGRDGSPTTVEDWLVNEAGQTYLPFYFYMHPTGSNDPFGLTTAPTGHVNYVKANGLEPAYQAELLEYQHIDVQHLVRYTGPAKALAWLANDSLAKDDLELQAELCHLTYHNYENSKYHHIQGTTMLGDRVFVDAHPGTGFDFGRGEGWILDTMTAAYELGTPAFRSSKFPWFQDITQLIEDGQSDCTGFINANIYLKLLNGDFRVMQSIENAIIQNAMFSAMRSVLRNTDQLNFIKMRTVLQKSLTSNLRPEYWHPDNAAPFTQVAVAPKDATQPPFCGFVPSGGQSAYFDGYQIWPSMAYGLALVGDPAYFEYTSKLLGAPMQSMLSLKDLGNLSNQAALFAVAEYLWK
jgi:hypothetical protein